jgi:hypothetical protein
MRKLDLEGIPENAIGEILVRVNALKRTGSSMISSKDLPEASP